MKYFRITKKCDYILCDKMLSLQPNQVRLNNFCCRKHHYLWMQDNPNLAKVGRKISKETREKLRLSHIGKVSPKKGKYYPVHPNTVKTQFVKGQVAHNKGKTLVEMYGEEKAESIRCKQRQQRKGKHPSKESIEKSALKRRGVKRPKEVGEHISLAKKGRPNGLLGKPRTEETKRKCSESKKGHLCYNWQGGISFEPYGVEFNNILKEQIRLRDRYRCQQCFRHQDELFTSNGRHYKLSIHHIDYNKQNNNFNNLISLCRNCHGQTGFDRDDWTNYFKGKLE